jgi:hypothetical protein
LLHILPRCRRHRPIQNRIIDLVFDVERSIDLAEGFTHESLSEDRLGQRVAEPSFHKTQHLVVRKAGFQEEPLNVRRYESELQGLAAQAERDRKISGLNPLMADIHDFLANAAGYTRKKTSFESPVREIHEGLSLRGPVREHVTEEIPALEE